MQDRKWQYKVVKLGGGVFRSAESRRVEIEEAINRLGLERWELVQADKKSGEITTTFYFKRAF